MNESNEIMNEKLGSTASLQIEIEEYRSLWTYYIRTLDERHKVIEYYFRTVTIPASFFGLLPFFASGLLDKFNEISRFSATKSLSAVSLLILLVGVSLFLYYTAETCNSKRYISAMRHMRTIWKRRSVTLSEIISVDEQVVTFDPLGKKMPLFRAGPMVFINSALASLSCLLYFETSDLISFVVFVSSVALHLLLWSFAPKAAIYEPQITGVSL